MADNKLDVILSREKYLTGWNKLMIQIWQEQIFKLKTYRTMRLFRGLHNLSFGHDNDFSSFDSLFQYQEYGLWVDLGVGKEIPKGNPGDIGRQKVRKRKRWMTRKWYASTMAARDFMAESLGDEFKAVFTEAFRIDNLRRKTHHYKQMGYS